MHPQLQASRAAGLLFVAPTPPAHLHHLLSFLEQRVSLLPKKWVVRLVHKPACLLLLWHEKQERKV
jgi:hypothetical protein